jgi:hypothetical protein
VDTDNFSNTMASRKIINSESERESDGKKNSDTSGAGQVESGVSEQYSYA